MFYVFLLTHLVADFILQPYWLVRRKRHWDGLAIHGLIVLGCMLALGLVGVSVARLWPLMLAIAAIHVAADWWKVHRADRLFGPPILPFLLDQLIHIGTLVVALVVALPATVVWGRNMPGATLALYAAGYIVAGCAVPIGVMVWLDPRFAHAALAPGARLRALGEATVLLALVLMAGALALPATLLGLVVVLRRPASAHPLDSPRGVLAVLCGTALVAAALRLVVR
jgi:hypothetical protein